jgi:peptidoglycan/LPS O-acetylase OafA/YrhL
LLVVLFHTQELFDCRSEGTPFGGMFSAGHRGVDLFFVLSGFIIAYVHAGDVDRPDRLPNYIFNRIARIYPAVWIMTLLALVLYSVGFGGPEKAVKLVPEAILASALLLPQHGPPLVNVTWTLTYEIFFYVIFAAAIVNLRVGVALLVVWQAATLAASLLGAELGLASYYLRSLCLEFSVGLACALWTNWRGSMGTPILWFGVLAAGGASFVVGMMLDRVLEWSGVFCALGAGATILALVQLERTGSLGVPKILVFLGGASYSIYLVHFSVITLFARVTQRFGLEATDLICLLSALAGVAVGAVFDIALDKPIQRWLRRRKKAVLNPELV